MKRHMLAIIGPIVLTVATALGQVVLDTSFEKGDKTPEGWQLAGCPGAWETVGHTGGRSVSVTGDGENQGGWVVSPCPMEPKRCYRFSVWHKGEKGDEPGTLTMSAGGDLKLGRSSPEWQKTEFVFRTPDALAGKQIRLGQWHLKGKVLYDDCRIEHVSLGYLEKDGITLGDGERIENGAYIFEPNFGTPHGDCFRVDEGHTVTYHSDMWWFTAGQYAVERYRVGSCKQLSGEVFIKPTRMDERKEDNQIIIEVSPDGKTWEELAKWETLGEHKAALPARLFPAEEVFVRISGKGSVQVRGYRYSAKLDGSPPNLAGKTEVFNSRYAVVENGPLRLAFEKGSPCLASICWKGKPVGEVDCLLTQFEKKGIGYKGTGVGIAEATAVKSIAVKTNEPTRCVIDVTAERTESTEAGRKFEATYEFTIYAGQDWFESRLLSIKNTDTHAYELRGYFHRLQPSREKGLKAWCFPGQAAWGWGDGMLGAVTKQEDDFTLGLRLSGGTPRGDITRRLNAKLAPGETWSQNEPGVILFVSQGSGPKDLVRESDAMRRIALSPETHAKGTIALTDRTGDATEQKSE